jgi:hypothetical protein
MHAGKGGGMAATFGGASSSAEAFIGPRQLNDHRATVLEDAMNGKPVDTRGRKATGLQPEDRLRSPGCRTIPQEEDMSRVSTRDAAAAAISGCGRTPVVGPAASAWMRRQAGADPPLVQQRF